MLPSGIYLTITTLFVREMMWEVARMLEGPQFPLSQQVERQGLWVYCNEVYSIVVSLPSVSIRHDTLNFIKGKVSSFSCQNCTFPPCG
jgi:hypothetical protein